MKATITYCFPCHYQAEALTAADALLIIGADSVELVKGTNGIFNIVVSHSNSVVSYTKPIGASFPTYDYIVGMVEEAKATSVDA